MWSKTVEETIGLVASGDVTEGSLDYDLDYSDPARDGMDVMDWLHGAARRGLEIPVVHFHTANPVGGAMFADSWRDLESRHGLPWMDTKRLRARLIAI